MKKNLTIIALVTFSFVLLFSFDFIIKPAYAQTATAFNFNLNGARNQCDEIKGILNNDGFFQHFYGCIANESNADSHTFSFIESASETPITTTLQVFPQTGGCSAIINPCNANGGSVSGGAMIDKTGQSGKLAGIWCGVTSCYTMWINNGAGYSHQLLRITFTPGGGDEAGVDLVIDGYLNFSSSFSYAHFITGIDNQRIGIGSATVYLLRCADASCLVSSTSTLLTVGGLQQMGVSRTDAISQFFKGDQTATNGWGLSSIDACHLCDGNITNVLDNSYLIITSKQGGTTNRAVDVWDRGTNTIQCGGSNTSLVTTTGQNTAIGRFYNQTRWIYAVDANIYLLNLDTCTKQATTSYATLGLANYISDIKTNTSQTEEAQDPIMHTYGGVFWIQHGNASALTTLTQVNATTFNTLVNFDNEGTGAHISSYIGTNPHNSLNSDIYSHSILRTATDSKAQIIFLSNFTPAPVDGGGGGDTGGTDCTDPANEFILICRLGGTPTTEGIGDLVGDGFTNLACNVIFVDCTDTNPQTNGIGLLIFIASIFVIVGMFYYTIGKEAFHMPIFIWIVIIIALSAFFTLAGIIDPVFLILSVVAIVALAVPKVISIVSGSTFGRGSTA